MKKELWWRHGLPVRQAFASRRLDLVDGKCWDPCWVSHNLAEPGLHKCVECWVGQRWREAKALARAYRHCQQD